MTNTAPTNPTIYDRIEELKPRLLSIAKQHAADALEADDIHSEIVLEIIQRSSPVDSNARILTIAKWAVSHHHEKAAVYSKYVATELSIGANAVDPETDADCFEVYTADQQAHETESAIIASETLSDFELALAALTPENQQVVKLLKQGFRPVDIAKKLGVTKAAISGRLDRIADTLRMYGFSAASLTA